jgi:hypothetical protein
MLTKNTNGDTIIIMNYENFTEHQQTKMEGTAHTEALRANRVGKSLASKAIKMVARGISTEPIGLSPVYAWHRLVGGVDFESSTLALNAELREREAMIEARLIDKWDGSVGDPGSKGFIEIKMIDGQAVETDATPGWKNT